MRTPALDGLAAQGARFNRAYCANPVCTPSRVSLMTGQLPSRHGSYNIGTVAADCSRFLSTVLTREGYRTHQLGKAHSIPGIRRLWKQPVRKAWSRSGILRDLKRRS